MAHHASTQPARALGILPGGRRAGTLLVVAFTAVSGIMFAGIWYLDGFTPAEPGPPVEPGTALTNDLFSITVQEAEVVTEDSSIGRDVRLQIRAELTSHEWEAQPARIIQEDLLDIQTLPEPDDPDDDPFSFSSGIILDREQPFTTSWVQPQLTETVVMWWGLEEDTNPEDIEGIRVTVLEAEYRDVFVEQALQWRATLSEDDVGHYELPITWREVL